MIYQIDMGYFCAGIIVEKDIIIETAPILNWSKGKNIRELQQWVEKKKGKINGLR